MNDFPDFIQIFTIVFSIIGSLALFLFGMKTMSEALQKLIGGKLRKSISTIVSNKYKGFLSGFIITGSIQSSTSVSIMLVSFINAGIFSLEQALSFMIGANVGTTVTAWLVVLLGFHSNLEFILLPIMALALPLLFRKNKQHRSIAELITGFVLIFTGFYFLKDSLPTLSSESGFVNLISGLSYNNYATDLLYAAAGILLTILIRSSSASIALTIVMCYDGWMSYENAAAMIIGANIGTTLTANLAARIAHRNSKRLALGHTIFNLFGAIIVFTIFRPFAEFIAETIQKIYGQSPYNFIGAVPLSLAFFHTGFNIIIAVLALALFKPFSKLLELIIPLKAGDEGKTALKYIDIGYLNMGELSLIQAQDEIVQYGLHVKKMFSLIPLYLTEKEQDRFNKLRKRINKFEDKADALEVIISNYLTLMSVDGLTVAASRKVSSMLKITDNIESIADQCMQLERTIRLKNEAKAWLSPEVREEIVNLFSLVEEAIDNMNKNLSIEYSPGVLIHATELEIRINNARDNFIKLNKQNIDDGKYTFSHGSFFTDIANHCEKIGDHVININQAIASNLK